MSEKTKAIRFLLGMTAVSAVAFSGCQVAPSKPVRTAGTGAVVGAVGGAVVGNNTGSGNAASGAAVGGLAGAVVGGVVGMVQEARERSEQDRLAQERAYQQALAKRRADEARFRAAIEEELALAEGYRISEQEISQVEDRARSLESRLKALQQERQAALARKRTLDTAQGRIAAAEQEIERLEAELAELRGAETPALTRTATPSSGPFIEHRVAQGETIDTVAARYKVPISIIREINSLAETDALVSGQVLRIPVPVTIPTAAVQPRG